MKAVLEIYEVYRPNNNEIPWQHQLGFSSRFAQEIPHRQEKSSSTGLAPIDILSLLEMWHDRLLR